MENDDYEKMIHYEKQELSVDCYKEQKKNQFRRVIDDLFFSKQLKQILEEHRRKFDISQMV